MTVHHLIPQNETARDRMIRRRKRAFALANEIGLCQRDDRIDFTREVCRDWDIESWSDLTGVQLETVIVALEGAAAYRVLVTQRGFSTVRNRSAA